MIWIQIWLPVITIRSHPTPIYTDTDDEDDVVDENEEKEEDEKEDSTDKERPDSGDDKEKGIKDISKGALTYEKEKLKKEPIDDKLLKTKLTNPTTVIQIKINIIG